MFHDLRRSRKVARRRRASNVNRWQRVGLQHEQLEPRLLLSGTTTTLFADSFENAGPWTTNWVQDSQNDWFRSTQRATDGSHSAEVDGRAKDSQLTLNNAIDLTPYNSAQLTYSWLIEKGLDRGEYLALDFSADGGSNWTEIAKLKGNVDKENAWHNETVDITSTHLSEYLTSSTFMIQFRGKMSGRREDADVDNVKIVGEGVPNNPPAAQDDSATTNEDTPVTIDVLDNDSDPDGDALTVSAASDPAYGTVVVNQNQTITYTPTADYNGSDSFTYDVSDGFLAKYASDGQLTWVTAIDGSSSLVSDVVLDEAGDAIYVMGTFQGTADFGFGTTLTYEKFCETSVVNNGFIVKYALDPDSGELSGIDWIQQLKTYSAENLHGVLDDTGAHPYVAGTLGCSDAAIGDKEIHATSGQNALVLKLDGYDEGNGAAYVDWAWSSQDDGVALGQRIAYQAAAGTTPEKLIIGGQLRTWYGTEHTWLGGYSFETRGGYDVFVMAMEPSDATVAWARSFGGTSDDYIYAVGADTTGSTHATGEFSNDGEFGATTLVSNGDNDAFVAKVDGQGNVAWAKQIGGSGTDGTWGDLAVDNNTSSRYIGGGFAGLVDLDFGDGLALPWSVTENFHGFVLKTDLDGQFQRLWTYGEPQNAPSSDLHPSN